MAATATPAGKRTSPTGPAAPLAHLVTGQQLAIAINLTERSIFDLRGEGMPHLKIGGKLLYDVADVIGCLKARYGVRGQQTAEAAR